MKPWYQLSAAEVQTFFDTDLSKGLNGQDVLKRLRRFGKNISSSLSVEIAKVYRVTVIRQGQPQVVSLQHIVPGDIVVLKPGNRVPADLRLFKVNHLQIDEAMFVGSNLPVAKNTYAITKTISLDDQKCIAFGGTFVTSGQGLGIVVAHGEDVACNSLTPKDRSKNKAKNILISHRLRRRGITINRWQHLKILTCIDVVFFDTDLSDEDIAETIRKVQLIKKIPCKFIVDQIQATRLQTELIGAETTSANQLAGFIPRHLISILDDTQFITDADPINTLKIVRVLKDNGIKVLWVSDGQKPMPAMQIAAISLIVGSLARDDVIYRASLIAPLADASIVPSILYNRK